MMRSTRVAFAWESGDVLLIDNYSAMHSRETFTAPRRILASLWGPPLKIPFEPRLAPSRVMAKLRSGISKINMARLRRSKSRSVMSMRGGEAISMQSPVADAPCSETLSLRTGAGFFFWWPIITVAPNL